LWLDKLALFGGSVVDPLRSMQGMIPVNQRSPMFVLTIKPNGHEWINLDLTNVIGANHGDVISEAIAHIPSGTETVFDYYKENALGEGRSWREEGYKN